MRSKRLAVATSLVIAMLVSLPLASLASDDVVVDGGGWGHGVGMPQYGARAMAQQGSSFRDILEYFYEGAIIGTVGQGDELVGHADPLRIGVAQNQGGIIFSPVGDPVSVCLGDECHPAEAGETWELAVNELGLCQLFKASSPVGSPGACEGEIDLSSGLNTKVAFEALGRTYARGKIIFTEPPANPGDLFHIVVELGMQEYLYGLGEMPSSWPAEALKAQAVAGRTYALYKAKVYANLPGNQARLNSCGCHLYASSGIDQKYIGWAKEAEGTNGHWGNLWRAAVDGTNNVALYHPSDGVNRALEAYYHSSTGGATENSEDWGWSYRPYLRSKIDPGPTAWDAKFSFQEFATALGFDSVSWVEIPDRHESGRPKTLSVQGKVNGSPTNKNFSPAEFRSRLGLTSQYVISVTGFIPPGADEVVLHDPSTGKWLYRGDNGSISSIYFGNPADYAFFGDWDCDGVATPGLYRQSDGYVYLRNSNTQGIADITFFFGNPGDVPIAGDFNGNGCDTVSIYRPSNQTFYIINKLGTNGGGLGAADYSYMFGNPGDVPFVGDWNGDGIDTPGLRRVSNGFVYLKNSNTTGIADIDYFYGNPGDLVFAGDWDGDGDDSLGLYRPSNGTVYLKNENSTGIADITYQMGSSFHKPVAG